MVKTQKLLILEANIDDMNPQWYEPLIDRLLAAGAKDVTLIPVIMKKSRPGVIVQVLSPGTRRDRLAQILFDETTTLGVRYYPVERRILPREIRRVKTVYGPVAVKVSRDGRGRIRDLVPEHDSCVALSKKKSVPVKTIYCAALTASSKGETGR